MEASKYRIDLPYPLVTLEPSDSRYARLISGAYAGKGSETTAIAQYRFHALYLSNYPQVLEAYRAITASEMLHQDLLGNLLKDLGWVPQLRSGENGCYWVGSFPDYNCRLLPMLEADAQGEMGAIEHYTHIIECVGNRSIQALLKRIILDEKLHLEILQGFIAQCP